MQVELTNILHILIIFQSWFFALVLFGYRSTKKISNHLLGAFLVALGLQMLLYLLSDLGYQDHWYMGLVGIIFTYGPLLFLYARSLIWRHFRLQPIDALHFLPFLAFTIGSMLGFNLRQRFGSLLYISIGTYLILIFREINHYQKVLSQTRTTDEQINLSWLKLASGLFALILFTDLFSFILESFRAASFASFIIDYLVLAMVVFFVSALVYKGLRQPAIFQGISTEEDELLRKENLNKALIQQEYAPLLKQLETYMEKSEPFRNPQLNISELARAIRKENLNKALIYAPLLKQLETYMEKSEPFRNPQLNISELATQLGIPTRQLSNIINQYYDQNFSDYINTYRIKLAQKRLLNPNDPKETILEVLYEAGFNSKSSFNTVFKKEDRINAF